MSFTFFWKAAGVSQVLKAFGFHLNSCMLTVKVVQYNYVVKMIKCSYLEVQSVIAQMVLKCFPNLYVIRYFLYCFLLSFLIFLKVFLNKLGKKRAKNSPFAQWISEHVGNQNCAVVGDEKKGDEKLMRFFCGQRKKVQKRK